MCYKVSLCRTVVVMDSCTSFNDEKTHLLRDLELFLQYRSIAALYGRGFLKIHIY